MRILLTLLIVLLLAVPAFARPVKMLVCDPPTTYNNGDPLAPEEIDGYKVLCGASPGSYSLVTQVATCNNALLDISTGEGENFCTVRTVAWGQEGDPSNEVVFRRSGTNFFAPPPQGVAPGAGAARLE